MTADLDVAIIGGGAAGLATAIFAGRRQPGARIVVFEGARTPGAKILVSGGTRCNVTNVVVTDADFHGAPRALIRRVLRAWPADATVGFFAELGVPLHEEAHGKLFPDSGRARDVLDALLRGVRDAGADLRCGQRVLDVSATDGTFAITTAAGTLRSRCVVLATGGLSLPKTGSDGWGYGAAARVGHGMVPTTPALVPLILSPEGPHAIHRGLSGVAQEVRLEVRVDRAVHTRVDGALLWTHFGVSGPAVLDASRHWLRARLEGQPVTLSASFAPGASFDAVEQGWLAVAREKPMTTVGQTLAAHVPASTAGALSEGAGTTPATRLATLTRASRRALLHALLDWPFDVRDSRGYSYAEVTAGGIPLDEVDTGSMESRRCPGLFLVGEVLDVDGRLGGFNFQWAWATGRVAGEAIARRLSAA